MLTGVIVFCSSILILLTALFIFEKASEWLKRRYCRRYGHSFMPYDGKLLCTHCLSISYKRKRMAVSVEVTNA